MGLPRRSGPPDAPAPPPAGVAAGDRTGLLIIRTWIEQGSSESLRAQIRVSTDVSAGFDRTVNVLRAEDVHAAVQTWLDDIMSDGEG